MDTLDLLKQWSWLFDRAIDSELVTLRCKVAECGYEMAFTHYAPPKAIEAAIWEHFETHSRALESIRL